jgi:hypothetical protein
LSPTFSKPLLAIRRISLTASEDPSGSWKKLEGRFDRILGGVRCGSVMEEHEAHRGKLGADRSAHRKGDADVGVMYPACSRWVLHPRQQIHMGFSRVGAASVGELEAVVQSAQASAVASNGGDIEEQGTIHDPIQQQQEPRAISSVSASSALAPNLVPKDISRAGSTLAHGLSIKSFHLFQSLLHVHESLPSSGLAVQLGYIGDVQSQYTLSEYLRVREQSKLQVTALLHQLIQYVLQQIQSTGQAIQEALTKASAQLSKPNRKQVLRCGPAYKSAPNLSLLLLLQAHDLKFDLPDRESWKLKSPSLAKDKDQASVEVHF